MVLSQPLPQVPFIRHYLQQFQPQAVHLFASFQLNFKAVRFFWLKTLTICSSGSLTATGSINPMGLKKYESFAVKDQQNCACIAGVYECELFVSRYGKFYIVWNSYIGFKFALPILMPLKGHFLYFSFHFQLFTAFCLLCSRFQIV